MALPRWVPIELSIASVVAAAGGLALRGEAILDEPEHLGILALSVFALVSVLGGRHGDSFWAGLVLLGTAPLVPGNPLATVLAGLLAAAAGYRARSVTTRGLAIALAAAAFLVTLPPVVRARARHVEFWFAESAVLLLALALRRPAIAAAVLAGSMLWAAFGPGALASDPIPVIWSVAAVGAVFARRAA